MTGATSPLRSGTPPKVEEIPNGLSSLQRVDFGAPVKRPDRGPGLS